MEKRKKIPMLVTCIIIITIIAGMSTALNTSAVKAEDTTPETTEEPPEEPHGEITITGTAFQECEPDLLVIILKIKTLDSESAEKARDEAARIIDNVLKSLKTLGIQDEYIETTSYKIQPKYEWENDVRVFKGYQVVVTIKVTLKDFNKAGPVIDNSVNAGAYVDSINFELSREKQNNIKIQLLAEAARDAKIKAEAIVTALGDELGNVKRVKVNDYSYQPYRYWAKSDSYGVNGESMAPPTQIMPSDLTLSANVNVVFEIL